MMVRNKVYIAFDGDKDIQYYYLMKAWNKHDAVTFNFSDAHDINTARDTSTEETIKRRLSERMASARCLIVLIGESTKYLYKFIRWEIELAIKHGLPIIAVNLNGGRAMDKNRCPSILANELAIHIPFKQAIIKHAIDEWPSEHKQYRLQNRTGPFYYYDRIYTNLGL